MTGFTVLYSFLILFTSVEIITLYELGRYVFVNNIGESGFIGALPIMIFLLLLIAGLVVLDVVMYRYIKKITTKKDSDIDTTGAVELANRKKVKRRVLLFSIIGSVIVILAILIFLQREMFMSVISSLFG